MDLELQNKRALITGGSRGIGKAIALELAREGAAIAIAARDEQRLKAAASEITEINGRPTSHVSFDSTSDDSVAEMVAQVASELGGIDILVNSAAPPGGGSYPWNELRAKPVLDDLNTKAMGYLRCAQQVAPLMVANGWGRIISIGGHNGRRSDFIIGTLRNAAVVAEMKNLADELGPLGINVMVVHPGFTRTDGKGFRFTPDTLIGRFVNASEVASVVTFLASPRSAAMTGDVIGVGGGVSRVIYY